jgi:hypothetical protein
MNPSYPGIERDFRNKLHLLATLKPDIPLSSHTEAMDLEAKRARAAAEGPRARVDPEGYRRLIAAATAALDARIDREMGVPRGK